MSGRAIYDPTSGRCLWSEDSDSPGRALFNPLPALPPAVYVQMGVPWATWWTFGWDGPNSRYSSGGLSFPGDIWRCHVSGGSWVLHYELNSGGYMVAGADWTNDAAGAAPWDVFGYYSLVSVYPPETEYQYQRVRIVSTILQLSTSAYTNILPDGGTENFTLRLTAVGAKRVRVDSITYPDGFTGATWAGVLAPGEYHEEAVSASVAAYPPQAGYSGDIVVATNISPFMIGVSITNNNPGCD